MNSSDYSQLCLNIVALKVHFRILERISLHHILGHRNIYWPFRYWGYTGGRQNREPSDEVKWFPNTGQFPQPQLDEEKLNLFSVINHTFE